LPRAFAFVVDAAAGALYLSVPAKQLLIFLARDVPHRCRKTLASAVGAA